MLDIHSVYHSTISGRVETGRNCCPDCRGTEIFNDYARGERICATCGLVISEHTIDMSRAGRRAFSFQEKNQRDHTGTPISPLIPDIGVTTVISTTGNLSLQMKRIIKWNNRMSWSNRNMLIASTEIKRIGSLLNLPSRVKETAAKIYRRAFHAQLLRGRSIKGMVAACVYYACRVERIPRTLIDILQHTDIDPKDVRRSYRTLIKELRLSVPNLDPALLVPKYVAKMELDNGVEKTAIKLIIAYNRKFAVAGRDPKGILAAALYVSCMLHHESHSQRMIAEMVQVTEVTLRSRYKEMIKMVRT